MTREPALDYLVLRCTDLERSRLFYEALGLRLVEEQHGRGARHYSAKIGEVVLELYPVTERPTTGVRLGIRVADVKAVVEKLGQLGASVVRLEGDRPDSVVVSDPDGHLIALAWME